jgi:hypothetical protein
MPRFAFRSRAPGVFIFQGAGLRGGLIVCVSRMLRARARALACRGADRAGGQRILSGSRVRARARAREGSDGDGWPFPGDGNSSSNERDRLCHRLCHRPYNSPLLSG